MADWAQSLPRILRTGGTSYQIPWLGALTANGNNKSWRQQVSELFANQNHHRPRLHNVAQRFDRRFGARIENISRAWLARINRNTPVARLPFLNRKSQSPPVRIDH